MKTCALFDFADTLAELHPNRYNVVATYIENASGIKIDMDLIARAYKAVDLLMPFSSVNTKTTPQRADFYRNYNQKLLSLLGVAHLVNPSGLNIAFGEARAHWQLKHGVREMLSILRSRGYSIGIISNFDSRLEQIVHDHLGLSSVVDYLHISQSEGVEKPDPQFYVGFFARHGLDIAQAVYTGDSYHLDYLPASSLGLRAFLLDEAGFYQHLPDAIRNFNELIERIDA
jgi:HAD superfamily hydrolase (TIGR01549 family)